MLSKWRPRQPSPLARRGPNSTGGMVVSMTTLQDQVEADLALTAVDPVAAIAAVARDPRATTAMQAIGKTAE